VLGEDGGQSPCGTPFCSAIASSISATAAAPVDAFFPYVMM